MLSTPHSVPQLLRAGRVVGFLGMELALADPYSIDAPKLAFKTLEFMGWRSIAPLQGCLCSCQISHSRGGLIKSTIGFIFPPEIFPPMNFSTQQPNWSIALVLIIGVLAISTASILIRLANRQAGTGGLGFSLVLAASRLAFVRPDCISRLAETPETAVTTGISLYAGAAGLCLAAHFALWITSLIPIS